MRILLLGPERPQVENFIRAHGDTVVRCEEAIHGSAPLLNDIDYIISYGYRHILGKKIVARFRWRLINLHISLLPWNRGADSNLWSFLENTPKGVTIHYIDEGLDTGDILAQQPVALGATETLRSSYKTLSDAIEDLFFDTWDDIRRGLVLAHPQPLGGTYHRVNDKVPYMQLLSDGWDTPVRGLIGRARQVQREEHYA